MSEIKVEQDFSAIGIDADVADMIRMDIGPDNPDRFENAGIWGGLIVEGAMTIMEKAGADKIVKHQFVEYLFEHLEPASEEGEEAERVGEFIWSLTYDEIVNRDSTYIEDRRSSLDLIDWKVPITEIEDFVANGVKRREERLERAKPFAAYAEKGHEMSAAELSELLEVIEKDGREGYRHESTIRKEIAAKQKFLATLEPILENLGDGSELHEKYGAKAANLMQLDKVLDKLHESDVGIAKELKVPRFMAVGVDTYDSWRQDQSIDEQVSEILEWLSKNPDARYAVRSSSVHSEDGEHTGAGIYESVLLPEKPTPAQIIETMEKVYKSVDSTTALAYRNKIGVDEEKMGLVIQEVGVDNLGDCRIGTINTVMNGVSELADYSIEEGVHPLSAEENSNSRRRTLPLNRTGMLQEFGLDTYWRYPDAPRFHVPPDTNVHFPYESWLATQASILAEKIAGRPIQVEFAFDGEEEGLSIVQSRPLPQELLKNQEFIGFPAREDVLYKGRSVGVLNGVEALVTDNFGRMSREIEEAEEKDENLSVVFSVKSSHASGGVANIYIDRLSEMNEQQRKKIIVLVKERPSADDYSGYGHLETLFAEMGISLICHDPRSGGRIGPQDGQKVTVYSNGYEGKIYPVSS